MHHLPSEFIRSRRSIRRFRLDPVPEETIRDILECGSLAPTARNIQPWLLGAVTRPELRHRLSDLAEYGRFIRESPVCFAVFTLGEEKYYLEDLGLGACWVAGDKKEYGPKVQELLGVGPEYKLVSLIACGYPDENPKPKKKRPEEVIFRDRYGEK